MTRFLSTIWFLIVLGLTYPGMELHARAETISNIAHLAFELNGTSLNVDSNTVSFDTVARRTASSIAILRKRPGADGIQIPSSAGQCKLADGAMTAIELPQSGADSQSPSSLGTAISFQAGDIIYLSLSDADQNLDPAIVESVEVTVTTSSEDLEIISLFESGTNTGVFVGALPTHNNPPPAQNDCRLFIRSGDKLQVHYTDSAAPDDVANAELLIDPYGIVFDSQTGTPVNGVSVTLINNDTGLPAQVFGDDGISPYPSTVISGESITDSGGNTYAAIIGGYRFPFVAPGRYRLRIEPPANYSAPSRVPRSALTPLLNPEGKAFVIEDGSFSLPFDLVGPQPLRIDIPIDHQTRNFTLEKTVSVTLAETGDYVHYRLRVENRDAVSAGPFAIVDDLPRGLNYKAGSVRTANNLSVDEPGISPDARRLTFTIPGIAANGTVEIGYTVVVGPDAVPGTLINRATAFLGPVAISNEAQASLRIRPPFLTDAATIIGRISVGQCGVNDAEREGLAGVRLLLEDGTYVISDAEGRYHFEGITPGIHVVQMDVSSLPEGYEPADCVRNSRHGGRSFSTFVDLAGGSLWRADFVLIKTSVTAEKTRSTSIPEPLSAPAAAGGETDWLAGQTPGNAILFPQAGHNPRAPAQRVVVKHSPGTKVNLTVNGVPVSQLAFDGTRGGVREGVSVSTWRGLPLNDGKNVIMAKILDGAGHHLQTLDQSVWFTNNAARATIVTGNSTLVADGRSRPVIAVRITDSAGRPVRGGSTGKFRVSAPYLPAAEVDAQQERQLAGMDARPTEWHVRGDDGIAYIELAPTTQTGTLTLGFDFQSERQTYSQDLEAWLSPGESDWIVVGYVAGTTGFNTLRDKSKIADPENAEHFTDGEINFYAKGRILGKWLMTLAYDEDRKRLRPGEQRQLLRTIDPDRYYTVYGDGTEQRYDAPTSDRLYLRLEREQFYALYGDFETGLSRTELTRYSRTLTGIKTEYRSKILGLTAFAAETGLGFARDEIQGNGLSGPYRLSRNNLVINSDKVTIEVRDRFQSQTIIETRPMVRHIDYDIDAFTGTLRFREPIPSRDPSLNPVFIIVDYETESTAKKYLNTGGRASVKLADGKVEVGASYIRDEDNAGRTDLGGIDVRIRPRDDTEIRFEAAHSDRDIETPTTGEAFIAEIEHHGERVNVLSYFRQQAPEFGVGQQNAAQGGTRKYGAEGSVRLSDAIQITANAYREEYLVGPASRTAVDLRGEYKGGPLSLRSGLRHVADKNQNAETRRSDLLTLGVSHEFFDRKLIVDLDVERALGGSNDSIDFPSRYRIGARYAFTDDVRLILSHEITDGDQFDAQTTQVGFDIAPWRGGRLTTTLNQRGISEYGPRTFAALGMTQSLIAGEKWGFDVAFDSNSTLSGQLPVEDVLNREHPAANGGFLGESLTEDFWALSLGATYRTETLSWNGRIEYRDGDNGDRYGIRTAVLRQTRAGIALAASADLYHVKQIDPLSLDSSNGTSALVRLSAAYRPEDSQWSLLDRLDFKLEDVSNGTLPVGFGPPSGFQGLGGKSRRIVNNLALNRVSRNWINDQGHAHEQRAQLSIYWGAKYVFDRYDGMDFSGFSQIVGVEARRDITEKFDLGLSASALHVADGGRLAYSIGPNVGASPFTNVWLSIGYNVAGYYDRDFSESRYTRDGPYVTFRLKLDQMTPEAIFGNSKRR